jgi:hypothetical protein
VLRMPDATPERDRSTVPQQRRGHRRDEQPEAESVKPCEPPSMTMIGRRSGGPAGSGYAGLAWGEVEGGQSRELSGRLS